MPLPEKPRPPDRSIRIAMVYTREVLNHFSPYTMAFTRWLRISQALARLGYLVDMIVNTNSGRKPDYPDLRLVPYTEVDWHDYDVIKTLFHRGFHSLAEMGAADHPFIISKLGSVVGASDATEGVYFFGEERQRLYELQQQVARKSRFVTLLTDGSKRLWQREHGDARTLLMVPTGVDRCIPPPRRDPYLQFDEKIAVYIGNLYVTSQRQVNVLWQKRLNRLGRLLKRKKIRLCLIGPGQVDLLDRDAVTYLGAVENDRIWDYHHFADAGIALAQGAVQHNESSKIYYYLRAGLPVVSEVPIPNNDLIREAGLGLIADYGNDELLAALVEEAVFRTWDREGAIRYMIDNHTWDKRVQVYRELIDRWLG